ncbi:hypothetical protein [Thalassotalea euphylliae]|uniref:Uncharacterized protein n=1 Tax=Thalassotalea euphylliae TaxID=1655234 RepID=A0A3E0U2R6_9GAMM|nr:hypothetical protein [Thalassotalea euphylliae]REL31014.1 hypothetical protein DXX94_09990 [Thalassotalea euphylliae]
MTSITLASESIANCANSDSIDVQNTDSESKAESNKPTECQTRKQGKFIHALAELLSKTMQYK